MNRINMKRTPFEQETVDYCQEAIERHDDICYKLGYNNSFEWIVEQFGILPETTKIYGWDADHGYHEIIITRTEATRDNCSIRICNYDKAFNINITWVREA